MGVVQIQDIHVAYGDRDLLKEVSCTLSDGARAALAGGNGSGKSTLLKIIAGLQHCDRGTVTCSKGMRISYLPQSDIVHKGTTLFSEVEKGYERFLTLIEKKHALEKSLATLSEEHNHETLCLSLFEIEETLLQSSYYRKEAVIEPILVGLGFNRTDFTRTCEQFSGGWQMRIALAKILVEDPDVLLLDEPTNYLDIEARIWLRNYIKQFNGSVIVVSHDQDFLDETVNEVFELFNGKLTRYSGNYSSYLVQRQQEIEQLEKAYQNQVKEIEKTEQFIERFRYKASKARQVQSREKQLEKLEIVQVPSHLRKLTFSFPNPPHCGNDILSISDLRKSYGSLTIFSQFNLMINKGDRLAVTGKNGTGKSTLLRILAQKDTSYSGVITWGEKVVLGYFEQEIEQSLHPHMTVYQEAEASSSTADIPRLRSLLGSFLFSNDDIDKPVSVLSGGERSRLALLKILLNPANVLILDEPTNHLDINAKHMLLQALTQYPGTLIFVSHDTHFIKQLATRILYVSDSEPELFEGDYDYFSWKLEQKEAIESIQTPKLMGNCPQVSESHNSYKESNRIKNRIRTMKKESEELLKKIQDVEEQRETILAHMSLEENYSNSSNITALVSKKEEIETLFTHLEETWFNLLAEIEELEGSIAI